MPVPSSFGASSSSSGSGGGGLPWQQGSDELPERLPQRTVLATVAKLIFSLNDEQRRKGEQWLKDNENQFTDQDLSSYGLQRPPSDDRSLLKKVGGGILSGVEQVGNVLGRPGQFSMHALNAVGTGLGGLGLAASGQVGIGDVGEQFAKDLGNTAVSAVDMSGSHDINAREMLNLDRNAGGGGWAGRAIGLADTAGMLAVDPLSWMGASGAGQATKFGLKAFEKGTAGSWDNLVREGAAGLDDAALRTERAVEAGREMATEAGAGKRGWAQHILGGAEKDKFVGPISKWKQMRAAEAAEKYVPGRMAALEGTSGAERLVQNSTNMALNRGQAGLKFGGETILSKATMSKPFEKIGLFGEVVKLPNEALVRMRALRDANDAEKAQIMSDYANIGEAPPKTQRRFKELLEEQDQLDAEIQQATIDHNTADMDTLAIKEPNEAFGELEPKPMYGTEPYQRTEVPLGREQFELAIPPTERRGAGDPSKFIAAEESRKIARRKADRVLAEAAPKIEDYERQAAEFAQQAEAERAAGRTAQADIAEDNARRATEKAERLRNPDPEQFIAADESDNLRRRKADRVIAEDEASSVARGTSHEELRQDWIAKGGDPARFDEAAAEAQVMTPTRFVVQMDPGDGQPFELSAASLDELEIKYRQHPANEKGAVPFEDLVNSGEVRAYVEKGDPQFYHGSPQTHTGDLRPREEISQEGNLVGPGHYNTGDPIIGDQYAKNRAPSVNGEEVPTVPTLTRTTAKDPNRAYKPIDFEAPIHQAWDEDLRLWMEEQLDLAAAKAEEADRSPTLRNMIEGARSDLEEGNVNGMTMYEQFRKAMRVSHGWEESDLPIREFSEELIRRGYTDITHEGGNIVGRGKRTHPVRITLDPTTMKSEEVPWPNIERTDFASEFAIDTPAGPARATNMEDLEARFRAAHPDLPEEEVDALWKRANEQGAVKKKNTYLETQATLNEKRNAREALTGKIGKTSKTLEEGSANSMRGVVEDFEDTLRQHEEIGEQVKRLEAERVERNARIAAIEDEIREVQRTKGNNASEVDDLQADIEVEAQFLDDIRADIAMYKERKLSADELKAVKADLKKARGKFKKLSAADEIKREALLGKKAANEAERARIDADMPDLEAFPFQYDRMPIERFGGKLESARNRVRGFFQRDPGVKDALGERTVGDFKVAQEKQAGQTQHGGQDILRGYENLLEDARAENMDIEDELADLLNPALQKEGGVPALVQKYMDEGRPAAARLVQVASDEKERITAERIRLGLIDPDATHDTETWLKRMFSPEAQRYIDRHLRGQTAGNREKMSSKLASELSAGASTERRGIAPEAATGSKFLENEARRTLRANGIHIPKEVPIYNDNPILATATSGIELAGQKATLNMVQEMKGLKDNRGVPLISSSKKMAKAYGHQKVTGLPGGEQIYASPEIAKGLHRYDAIMLNDETMQALNRTLRKVNGIWKAQATVPLIGAAFHARNANTNVILNWIAGLENPIWYAKAKGLTSKIDTLMDKLGRETMDFDEILAKADNLTDQEKKWIKGARDHNVLQANYVGRGLESGESSDTRLRAHSPNRRQKALSLLNPTNQDRFLGVRTGRKLGRGIENNARMAHFMWASNEFGDEAVAAASVKKYLFDYDDLSDTEKAIKDKYIPFYTFMRKNAALMVGQMLENPGKLRRGMLVDDMSKDQDAPWLDATPGQGGTLIPGYQMKNNQAPRHLGPAALLGENVVLGMETPWGAAEEAIRPIVETAGQLPGTNRFVPDDFKNPEGTGGAARSLLNLPGGPVTEAIRVAAEHAYDTDTFTGGQAKRQGGFDKLADVAGIFMPSVNKGSRMLDTLKIEDTERYGSGKERFDRRKALALNMILGLAANATGPGANAQERESRYYELNDWIEKQNRGLALDDPRRIPTLEELEERGIKFGGKVGLFGPPG